VHPDDREHARRLWRDALAAGRNLDTQLQLRAAGGGWHWTRVHAAPIRDAAGGIVKWLGMNLEVTERREAEAAPRGADRQKNRFLVQLGHEPRNAPAAIDNMLEALGM
jgi:phosphatidylserine/phosphatidylglycerophosphate/cardiolipin synthase-like enzyme